MIGRVIAALLVLLVIWFQFKYWVGSGGVREVEALRARVEAQTRENAELEQRNAVLQAEVEDLREGKAALEERARSELGLIKQGETFYRVIEPPPADARSDP